MTIVFVLVDLEDREDRDDDYHAIPAYAVAEHEPSRRCQCRPEVEVCAYGVLVTHRERN